MKPLELHITRDAKQYRKALQLLGALHRLKHTEDGELIIEWLGNEVAHMQWETIISPNALQTNWFQGALQVLGSLMRHINTAQEQMTAIEDTVTSNQRQGKTI